MVTPSSRDSCPEAVARHRVDARGGFVENQHLRCMDHRYRQRQALAHAQRQRLGQAVDLVDQSETHLADARLPAFGRQVEQPGVQVEVLHTVSSLYSEKAWDM